MQRALMAGVILGSVAGYAGCSRVPARADVAPPARVAVTALLAHDSLSISVADQVREALHATLSSKQWQIVSPQDILRSGLHIYPGYPLHPTDLSLVGHAVRADVVIDVQARRTPRGFEGSAVAAWPDVETPDTVTLAVASASSARQVATELARELTKSAMRMRRPVQEIPQACGLTCVAADRRDLHHVCWLGSSAPQQAPDAGGESMACS